MLRALDSPPEQQKSRFFKPPNRFTIARHKTECKEFVGGFIIFSVVHNAQQKYLFIISIVIYEQIIYDNDNRNVTETKDQQEENTSKTGGRSNGLSKPLIPK